MKHYLFIWFLSLNALIYSQEVRISGHVTDSDNTSVTGAAIMIKGTTLGTVTDKNGFYSINKIKPGLA